jgi:NTE family protein
MPTSPSGPARKPAAIEECILVLQGGGALGAYQAGVYEALSKSSESPSWVAGISIGAINAALIAGNPPERRVERLREFWDLVSSASGVPGVSANASSRDLINEASATQTMLFGVPGFFKPRFPAAPFQPAGSVGAISFYDTTPLQSTLEQLVDFDLLNSGAVRLSVGAVNVRSGNFIYFDTTEQRIDARHIMASGALPPGFPPIEIDEEHYWDGGLVSNTPLQYVLDRPGQKARVVFQVDLFAAQGLLPDNMAQVTEREKDIRFSSRTRLNTDNEVQQQRIALAARRLLAKLPPALRNDPDARALAGLKREAGIAIVHLIYRSKHYESQSKDYEFSRLSMQEHWETGRADMAHTLHDPRWVHREHNGHGMQVFDLASGGPATAGTPSGSLKAPTAHA